MKKQYTLRSLQMGYLQDKLAKQEANTEEACMFCWEKGCGCNAPDVKTDAFLNLPNMNEEVEEYKQLQYA